MAVILTEEIMQKALSRNGALNRKQVQLLGLRWKDLKAGWKKSVIGKSYDEATIQEFLSLKDSHLENKERHKMTLFVSMDLDKRLKVVCEKYDLSIVEVIEAGLDAIENEEK